MCYIGTDSSLSSRDLAVQYVKAACIVHPFTIFSSSRPAQRNDNAIIACLKFSSFFQKKKARTRELCLRRKR